MTARWLQPNVMTRDRGGTLLLPVFPGKPMFGPYPKAQPRRPIMTVEQPTRSVDDQRRTAQMAAAQAGDRAAYEALLRDCVPLVKVVAGRLGVPPDSREDVVQDVLLTIHRARHTYDPARSFTAWLRIIAERRAIDLLRQARRRSARELHAPLALEAYPDPGADPARGLDQADASSRVTAALATLPPRQREAVQAPMLGQQSLAVAAAATGRTANALKVNLHRALKALRGRFGPAG
jgi:RNA polymerase sigma-70 factor (ECF subfamily)